MAAESAARRPTRRVELARLASKVLERDGGVVPTAGDGRWATADGEERIEGVLCSEATGGRVDVELHLLARWPCESLERLAAGVRADLAGAARSEGLDAALGAVDVSIHDLLLDERAAERGR